MAKHAKSILRKLIEDADEPFIIVWEKTKQKQQTLFLPSAGDPYYSVDANLTKEEFELIVKEFPDIKIIRQ